MVSNALSFGLFGTQVRESPVKSEYNMALGHSKRIKFVNEQEIFRILYDKSQQLKSHRVFPL
jgi:hypothetical protein